MAKELHTCEILQKSKADIDIEKIGGKWHWIFWGKKHGQAHAIKFCPYCGAELEKAVQNER